MPRVNRASDKLHAVERVAQNHRDDRRAAAGAGIQAALAGQGEELLGALVEPGHALGLGFEQPQRGQGRGRVGRRHAGGVDEAGRRVLQVFDQGRRAGDVAAATAQRLAERAHPDVDVAGIDAEVLADAASARAEHAQRVGLVDVEERLVALLDFDEPRQVGNIAVHAVHALDGDRHAAIGGPQLFQQLVERAPVVVREGPAAGARQHRALHDAVVGQRVVDDQVAGSEQVAERGFVGAVAADEDQRRVDADEAGQLGFELAVDRLFAGHEAAGRDAGAKAVDGPLDGGHDATVARHADVVVAGEADQLAAVDQRGVVDHPLVDLEVGVLEAGGQGFGHRLAELQVLGEILEAVVLGRHLVDHRLVAG